MNATTICLFLTIILNAALGIMVYLTNTRRAVNQLFLALSVVMSVWASCVLAIVEAASALEAERWMRAAFVVCTLIPGSFTGLLLAIKYPDHSIAQVYRRSWPFWVAAFGVSVMCLSRFFLQAVTLPPPGSPAVPEAVYGPGFVIYVAYFILASIAAVVRFVKDLIHSQAIKRVELQFVLLGSTVCVIIGTTVALFIPLLSGSTSSSQFGPLSSVALMLIIAYGIAKYRIMDVTQVLRRATAYVLLAISLIILYVGVWAAVHHVLELFGVTSLVIPNILATLVVALSMAPTHGHMQRFANQLFISVQEVDIGDTVRQTRRILHSIRTLPDLLQRFSEMVLQSVGSDHLALLLEQDGTYVQRYPEEPGKFPMVTMTGDDPLVRKLRQVQEPVVVDLLQRRRPTPERTQLSKKMASLKASIAIGIRSRRRLDGIMLLGPRLSGRIYGNIEQKALQILCDQLAVALENARLYTEAQDSKIYNEILLDNLPTGVVAADAGRTVSVFNREAQRITGLPQSEVLHQALDTLPAPLPSVLEDAFQTGRDVRDLELRIQREGESVPVRVGSSIFRGHAGNVMGALLILSDQTKIKKLELQVRRTDRLASVGTLSAGMAHEIKNPLVSIKTFSQLLPERYQDPDFRDTFSSLLDREVKRIDSIVNQLLHFARPAKPALAPVHLHQVLEESLRLVEQPLEQKGIALERAYGASEDMIQADTDLLDQAFLNFFLNAIEAMEGNGQLAVSTDLVHAEWNSAQAWPDVAQRERIRVSIRDSGKGIDPEDANSIFDPFFTTKSDGTGLGLSVAHGIIQEHGGMIDVESQVMEGTTFHVSFPLIAGKEES